MIYQSFIENNINMPGGDEVFKEESQITLTKTDREKLTIKVENEKGISKLTYSLNSAEQESIDIAGQTIADITIIMPTGENIIDILVVDINGKETRKQEMFIVEQPKPIIDLSVIGSNIKIAVISEIELLEVAYKWNSQEEKIENMITYKNRNEFEKQLEIPIGQNTLTVIAKDINGGITEKTQEIKGVTKATTKTNKEGEYWHFTVTAKENIEIVQFEFNGQKYIMNTETFGTTQKVHYKVKLVEGINYLIVSSKTQSGGTNTQSWETEYKAK